MSGLAASSQWGCGCAPPPTPGQPLKDVKKCGNPLLCLTESTFVNNLIGGRVGLRPETLP